MKAMNELGIVVAVGAVGFAIGDAIQCIRKYRHEKKLTKLKEEELELLKSAEDLDEKIRNLKVELEEAKQHDSFKQDLQRLVHTADNLTD